MMEECAGILVYRKVNNIIEFLVAHPGGPFHVNTTALGIPKGHIENDETPFECAIREFEEETGLKLPSHNPNDFIDLGRRKQNKKKNTHIYAFNWDDLDITKCSSNYFDFEYPVKSGNFINIPENDAFYWKDDNYLSTNCINGQYQFINDCYNMLDE